MKEYLEILKRIESAVWSVLLPDARDAMEKEQKRIAQLFSQKSTVKLPIVGTFNAGKTSLINAMLGNEGKLPIDIVPETSIPCEIYPVLDEKEAFAEILRNGETIFEGSLSEYGSFASKSGDLGRIYVKNPFIHNCANKGIVLVDMPGCDSGLKEHNDAILKYIEQGTMFALIISAEKGSLTASDIAFIREIKEYGLDLTVFLSKCDLVAPENLAETKEYVHYLAKQQIGPDIKIWKFSVLNGDISEFEQFVKGIDVLDINRKKFLPILKAFADSQSSALKSRKNLISVDISCLVNIDVQIQQIENEIRQIDQLINDSLEHADTPEKSAQDVLDYVSDAIRQNTPLIARTILNENIGQITEVLISVIRPALVNAFKDEQTQFIEALQTEVDKITEKLLSTIEIPKDTLKNIVDENASLIINGIRYFADRLRNNANPWLKIIGQALICIAEYVPDALRQLLGTSEKAQKKIEEKVKGPVAKAIVETLHPMVLDQVKEQQRHILEVARTQYAAKVTQLRETIKYLQEQKESGQFDAQKEITQLDNAIEELDKIYGSI